MTDRLFALICLVFACGCTYTLEEQAEDRERCEQQQRGLELEFGRPFPGHAEGCVAYVRAAVRGAGYKVEVAGDG